MRLLLSVALIAGASAFTPFPSVTGSLRRSASASCHRRVRPGCAALSAKARSPGPREGEREEDFDSDEAGKIRVECLPLGMS